MKQQLACSLVLVLVSVQVAPGQQTPAAASPVAAPPSAHIVAAPATTSAVTTPAPAIAAKPDASGKYQLREGEDVPLKFAQDLSSKIAAEGDPVTLILDEDLKVGDVVVAKPGSKAFGEITNAKKSGMMGKAGELNIRLDYLKVGDTKVKLRGIKGKEGQSGTTSAIVLTVLFGPIGLIKHGKNVEIKQGTPLKAYVADDIALLPAS